MIKSHEQQLELRLPRIGVIRKGAPKPQKARAAYRENVAAALASATQSDLFEIEDEPVKFVDPA